MTDPGSAALPARRWWLVGFVVALLAQSWALYTPDPPSGPDLGIPLDKIVHLLMFAAVAWLGVRSGIAWGWVAALLVAQALISEWVQRSLMATRSGDVWDLMADLLGIILGVAAGIVQTRRSAHIR